MYLLQLDKTGLIKDDVTGDGWKAIGVFRELVKKHKIEGLTVVALSVDYDSPFSYYSESDRFLRACEEVFGSRDKFKKTELVVEAIKKYDELQFNSDLEHDRIIKDYKVRLIQRIKIAMANETEEGEKEVERLNKTLRNHEESTKSFYAKFDKEDIINNQAVTASGYSLSRIEQDLALKKNSKFANEGKDIINPNKLGLSDDN